MATCIPLLGTTESEPETEKKFGAFFIPRPNQELVEETKSAGASSRIATRRWPRRLIEFCLSQFVGAVKGEVVRRRRPADFVVSDRHQDLKVRDPSLIAAVPIF
jgi:hypothetical protein